MSVSPADFLEIAQELLSEEKEIDYRSAANRAYYSAYHFCMPVADSLPHVPLRKQGTHERLIEKLKRHPIRKRSRDRDGKIRALGVYLEKGKPLRVHADYWITREFDRRKAEDLIEIAVQIRDAITEIEHD